ncbi:MAG: hypothetical protein ACW99A_18715 [Candidatus Kariarchaeaceae archaeon]|jgi:hypothetical protein
MTTSIKVTDVTKRNLERLQAKILLEFGKKFNQQELIDLLVKLGYNNLNLILATPKKNTFDTFTRIKSLIGPWKIETSPEIIDTELYG